MEDNNTGSKVTAVGAGLLVAASIFSAPLLAVWGTWAVVNGMIVNEEDKKSIKK